MQRTSLGAIFFTIALDLLGFGLVLPFLAQEARDTFAVSTFVATLLSAVYSLMQFLFAPLWGRLSDAVGRKPVLVWSIAATCVSNVALGAALAWGDHVGWLFAARVVAGMATANLSVASAYIADVTPPDERAKGMGLIGMAFGLGFVLGPGIGGLLAAQPIGGRHGPLACFAAGLLSAINVVWVLFGVGESLAPELRAKAPRRASPFDLGSIGRALSDPMVLRVVLVNFVLVLSFANLEQTFRFFNTDTFGMTERETGLVLALIGVVAAAVQGGLVRRIGKRVDESSLIRAGAAIQVVAFAAISEAPTLGKWVLYAGGAVLAVGNGLSQPGISAYVSLRAKEGEQGSVMGVNQSAASLGRVLGPGMGGLLYGHIGPRSPYVAGAVGMSLATAVALTLERARHSTSTQTS